MTLPRDGMVHTASYLSWKRLQLSRAKLKASSKTSALLSGFAMVAMVEMQVGQAPPTPQNERLGTATESSLPPLPGPPIVPEPILVIFAVCTTLLVAVHMLALMISTCILPNIEAISNLHNVSLVHESPHERLYWYIEIAWIFSTLVGLLLFLLEIAILCWVKFYDTPNAAWAACGLLIPILIIFLIFAIHFYKTLIVHKYEVTVSDIRELELIQEQMAIQDLESGSRLNALQAHPQFFQQASSSSALVQSITDNSVKQRLDTGNPRVVDLPVRTSCRQRGAANFPYSNFSNPPTGVSSSSVLVVRAPLTLSSAANFTAIWPSGLDGVTSSRDSPHIACRVID